MSTSRAYYFFNNFLLHYFNLFLQSSQMLFSAPVQVVRVLSSTTSVSAACPPWSRRPWAAPRTWWTSSARTPWRPCCAAAATTTPPRPNTKRIWQTETEHEKIWDNLRKLHVLFKGNYLIDFNCMFFFFKYGIDGSGWMEELSEVSWICWFFFGIF